MGCLYSLGPAGSDTVQKTAEFLAFSSVLRLDKSGSVPYIPG